jgi:hypothetical protein
MDRVIQSLSRQYVTSVMLLANDEGSAADYWKLYRECHEHLFNVLKGCSENGFEEAIDKLNEISREVENNFSLFAEHVDGLSVSIYRKAIQKFIDRIYVEEDNVNKEIHHENQH